MRKSIAVATTVVTVGLGLVVSVAPAEAADFCRSRISGATYVQKNFPPTGTPKATVCAPGGAGRAYLYARGSYANVKKYMKLVVTNPNTGSSATVDGDYYSYVYVTQGAGDVRYHAIMYDGHGNKVVDGYGDNYD